MSARALLALLRNETLPMHPNWTSVLRLARAHGLSGLCVNAIERHPERAAVPGAFRSACVEDREVTGVRNRVFIEQAETISRAFNAGGIDHRFYKGIALIPLYSHPGERVLSDIDIAVPAGRTADAAAILFELGYRDVNGIGAARLHHFGEEHFVARGPWPEHLRPQVDLHAAADYRRLSPSVDRDARSLDPLFWSGPLEAGRLPAPAAAAHTVLLLLHLYGHIAERLVGKWLWDIDVVATTLRPEDWRTVTVLLREHGLAGPAWGILRAMNSNLGTPVPSAVVDQLEPPRPVRALFNGWSVEAALEVGRAIHWPLVGWLWRAAVDDSPAKYAAGLYRTLVPTKEWLRAREGMGAERPLYQLRLRHWSRGMARVLGQLKGPFLDKDS